MEIPTSCYVIHWMHQTFDLLDPVTGRPTGRQIFGKGYATIEMRNVDFADDHKWFVRFLPPRCDIGS